MTATGWLLYLALTTGQVVILDVPTQTECNIAIAEINAGRRGVKLTNGLSLPIARALTCVSVESVQREIEAFAERQL